MAPGESRPLRRSKYPVYTFRDLQPALPFVQWRSMPTSPTPKNPTPTCRECGKKLLGFMSRIGRGFCMPHSHLGFSPEERIASRITLGRIWTLDAAEAEFRQTSSQRSDPLSGDSPARWADFAVEAATGGTIYEFTGDPRDEKQRFFPTRGFILQRDGQSVAAVVLESQPNDAYFRASLEVLSALAGPFEATPENLAQLVEDEKLDCKADYWGGPTAYPDGRPPY